MKDTKKVKEKYDTEAKRILLNFMSIAESSLRLRRVIKLFVDEGREAKKRQPALWWNSKKRALTTAKEA